MTMRPLDLESQIEQQSRPCHGELEGQHVAKYQLWGLEVFHG